MRIGRTCEVLAIVERFGDRAMAFVWRHKGALTVASVLAAFLADPEPSIHGVQDCASDALHEVGDAAVRPFADVPAHIVGVAAREINWTEITLVALAALMIRKIWKQHKGSLLCCRPNRAKTAGPHVEIGVQAYADTWRESELARERPR
jgi:hypothetical protein